jgi:hypothetical protein
MRCTAWGTKTPGIEPDLGDARELKAADTRQGRVFEAEDLAREVLAARTEMLGEAHPQTLNAMNSLITFINARGDRSKGLLMREKQLSVARAKVGDEHPLTMIFKHNHALSLRELGRWTQAEQICREVLEARRRVLPPGHEQTLLSMELLASILRSRHQLDDALAVLQEAAELAKTSLPPGHLLTASLQCELGNLLTVLLRYSDAESQLLDSLTTYRQIFGSDDSRTQTAASRCVRLYESWGRPEMASEVRSLGSSSEAKQAGR